MQIYHFFNKCATPHPKHLPKISSNPRLPQPPRGGWGRDMKKAGSFRLGSCCCGGRRTRTSDLWVMSPTSCHCSIPRYLRCKGTAFFVTGKKSTTKISGFNKNLTKNAQKSSATRPRDPKTEPFYPRHPNSNNSQSATKWTVPFSSTTAKVQQKGPSLFHHFPPNSRYRFYSCYWGVKCSQALLGWGAWLW